MTLGLSSARRVVVTGIGLVSGLGLSLDEVSRSLREGRSTIRVVPERSRLGFNSPLSGALPAGFDPREWLSAAELGALQTFPADYRIVGNNRSAHKQLGNAVPSALVELLGLEIRRQFFGQRVRRRPRLLPERRDPIPEPELPAKLIPAALRREVKVYAPHGGTGLGPSASRRAATRS